MNLSELAQKLKPTKHAFDLEGFTIYIHRPTAGDVLKCTDAANTVVLCTCDENGERIFCVEPEGEKIPVLTIGNDHVMKLYNAIYELLTKSDRVEEIEKK